MDKAHNDFVCNNVFWGCFDIIKSRYNIILEGFYNRLYFFAKKNLKSIVDMFSYN